MIRSWLNDVYIKDDVTKISKDVGLGIRTNNNRKMKHLDVQSRPNILTLNLSAFEGCDFPYFLGPHFLYDLFHVKLCGTSVYSNVLAIWSKISGL